MQNQIQSLTPLRGYAALFIVIYHFVTLRFQDLNNIITAHTSLLNNSYLMVDLFFILSGFVLAHVYNERFHSAVNRLSYGRFLFARFARIYPLHLFVLSGFVALELVQLVSWLGKNSAPPLLDMIGTDDGPFSGSQSLSDLGANLFLVHAWTLDPRATSWNHPSWSISSEWFAYLFVPFLLILAAKLNRHPKTTQQQWLIIAAIALPLIVLFSISISTRWGLDVAGIHGLIRCLAESWLGIVIYRIYHHGHLKELWQKSTTMLFFLAWIIMVMWFDANDTLAIPAFAGLILCASYNSGPITRFLNAKPNIYLGEISYSVYMTHIFVMQIFLLVWPKLTGEKFGVDLTLIQSLSLLTLSLAAVLVTSAVTYRAVELPARRWLRARYLDD